MSANSLSSIDDFHACGDNAVDVGCGLACCAPPPSATRSALLDVTTTFLSNHDSTEVRIVDVAALAKVGVPTVYYYFESRTHLVAMAQMHTYGLAAQKVSRTLLDVEAALAADDAILFWDGMRHGLELVWGIDNDAGRFGLPVMIMDIRQHEAASAYFYNAVEERFLSWVHVLEAAQQRGWVNPCVDVRVLFLLHWTSALGTNLFGAPTVLGTSTEMLRDFLFQLAHREGSSVFGESPGLTVRTEALLQ